MRPKKARTGSSKSGILSPIPVRITLSRTTTCVRNVARTVKVTNVCKNLVDLMSTKETTSEPNRKQKKKILIRISNNPIQEQNPEVDFCEICSEYSDTLKRRKCRPPEKVGLTFKKSARRRTSQLSNPMK
jgi:hypothetical protein